MTKALIIVAHPDDETIWMGGTILRNSKWDWTILSLCRENDPDRRPKFERVCEIYNAKSIISNLDDEILQPLKIGNIIKKIKKTLLSLDYDYVFTHGLNGEYGHIRHKEIHKAVKKMIKDGILKCRKLFFFSYRLPNKKTLNKKIPLPSINNDFSIKLKDLELSKKKEIINNIYGFQSDSFELLSCQNIEPFKVL